MMDYGHELEFGYFLIPDGGNPYGVLETARLADRLGYDLLAVQDHPYHPAHLDTLALLGVILAQTERIRVFQDVGNLPLRPPAAFAKAAATLDLLSGGRFVAGLGAGGFLDAAKAMGAPAWTPGQSLEALEEAIVILRSWWSTAGVLRFHGRHYELEGARPGPKPAHPIAIWLGAAKPRALALTGRKADGWAAPLMNYMPPADAAEAHEAIDRAAVEARRDPAAIRRIYNVPGAFTRAPRGPARDTDTSIVGPPDHWAEVLTHLAVDLGFSTFILLGPPDPGVLRTFIDEVAPDVRERVTAARAQAEPWQRPPPKRANNVRVQAVTSRALQVGISIIPDTDSLGRSRELVRVADEGGLALVGVQDHPYQHHFFDTWSLIPTLLAETKRISFFTDVASLPLCPPAVMAKAAASLDVLSGGRFELGLGGGALPELIANFGGPRRTPGETVEAIDEAINVLRLLWSQEHSVSFEGKHYRLNDARPGPRPAHPIAIWVGAFKPRMIRLVGRKADGWLPSLGVLTREELRAGNEQIDEAAEKAGRDPRSIRRLINIQGLIGEQAPPSRSELPVGYLAGEPLAGAAGWWVETIAGFAQDGFDTIVFWPVDPSPGQVELLIAEVVPQLSSQIGPRSSPSAGPPSATG